MSPSPSPNPSPSPGPGPSSSQGPSEGPRPSVLDAFEGLNHCLLPNMQGRVPTSTDSAEIMGRFVRSPKLEQDGATGIQHVDVEMVAT